MSNGEDIRGKAGDASSLSSDDPPVLLSSWEAAHAAYHEHNEVCACRTVGHLTRFIAAAVEKSLGSEVVEADGRSTAAIAINELPEVVLLGAARGLPGDEEEVARAVVEAVIGALRKQGTAELWSAASWLERGVW